MSTTSPDGIGPGRLRRRSTRALAGVGVGALAAILAACGSSNAGSGSGGGGGGSSSSGGAKGLYGAYPSTSGKSGSGGTVTIGQIKGSTPLYAMPITPSNVASVYGSYDFIDLMNQPVYWGPTGSTPTVDYALSLANAPVYSNGDKTVTITFKDWKFSNGESVTAADALLYIDVLKQAVKESAANFSNYTPGYFPDNVASGSARGQTLTLQLTKAYNPGYYTDDQLGLMYAFPQAWATDGTTKYTQAQWSQPAIAKKIYDYLNKQASSLSTFGTSPLWKVSDGPMVLTGFNAASGEYTMKPNPSYGGPVKGTVNLDAKVFTTSQAEFNELVAGGLDIGNFDPSDLPQVDRLKTSYAVFGLPDFGWQGAIFNFADTTGHWNDIIKQSYVRQALAHMVDQKGYIRGIFKNAAGLGYSTVPAVPASPYAPSNATPPYAYSPSTASKLLTSHGWKVVPNGQTTCIRPGSGSNECGAGIPAGTPLKFNWQYQTNLSPYTGSMSVAFASSAKQIGADVVLQLRTFNDLITKDSDPSAPSNKNTWAVVDFGGFTNSLYPTANTLFNTGGTFNLGDYNSTKANTLINASVYGKNPSAVKAESTYLAKDVPVLFQPNPDNLWAVSKKITGPTDAFANLTQYTWTPQYWRLAS